MRKPAFRFMLLIAVVLSALLVAAGEESRGFASGGAPSSTGGEGAPLRLRSEVPEYAAGRCPGVLSRLVAQEIDPDNIESIIDDLSYDPVGDTLLTRHSLRDETYEIALPYLENLLRENLGERGSVYIQPFPLYSGEDSPIAYNLVGRMEGSREGCGYYILSGHYDSIGSRTKYEGRNWDWRTDPAPGADDNASGVAAVLECARVLAAVELEFDLVFVLFSGEEQIIKGSTYYARNLEDTEEPLLGVINMDMIAYNPGRDTIEVVTDERSMWLADFLVDSYQELEPEIGELAVSPALKEQYLFSDETPFQQRGLPAVTCSEKLAARSHNPYYHTIDDNNLDGKLNLSQATKATRLVAGSLAALAGNQDPFDLEVLSADITFAAHPLPVVQRAEVGDTVTVSVRVRNVGGSMGESRPVRVVVYDGYPDRGAPVLGEGIFDKALPAMGGFVFSLDWIVTAGEKGSHRVTAVVSVEDADDANPANNSAQAVLAVVSDDLAVLEHYVYPNPGDPLYGTVSLHYFLTTPAGVTVEVFDAIGRRLGRIHRSQMGGSLIPGYNFAEISMPLEEVVDGFSDLAGGVYFYRLTAENEIRRDLVSGRFIMVR